MKSIIIIGATSGIGRETAILFIKKGYKVGIAGRRLELLNELKNHSPENVFIASIDINDANSTDLLNELIKRMGGTDIILNCAGIGHQNISLIPDIEMDTVQTNALGFTRIAVTAYNYFAGRGSGHFAAITSISGVKGLGAAPAYSATKRFQNIYLQSLSQLARINRLNIAFTDIMPGFVSTPLLSGSKKYPMLMKPEYVAKKIVKAIDRKKRRIIIDWRYEIMVFLWRLIPNCIWEKLRIKN